MQGNWNLYIANGKAKCFPRNAPEMVWQLNIHLSYDPPIPLLVTYPREIKMYVPTKTCAQIGIVVLFLITPHWKKTNDLSTGEWINQLWYRRAIKKEHTTIQSQIILKGKMISEGSQS